MPDEITHQDAQYALDIVTSICDQVGPGIPGSQQERERGERIRQELAGHLGAENVAVEEFTLAPEAFLGSYPGVICLVLAIALNLLAGHIIGSGSWIASLAGLIFAILTILAFVLEFVLGREVLDPIYPKKRSTNVIGTLRNTEVSHVRHLLIISGHHDSALQLTWLRYLGYGFYVLAAICFIGMLTMLVMSLIQLAGMVIGNPVVVRAGTLGWVLLIFPLLPTLIFMLFLTSGRENGGIVPGAADNLSASASVVAMCRFLVNNPSNIPADTEIRFISFGGEEACVRGSRNYARRHLDELRNLDVRVLNYEIIVHPLISIVTSDVGGVKHAPEMVNSAIAAAERAAVPYATITPPSLGGGTDAGPFTELGLMAVTLMPFKVPQQMVAFYHQDRDTPAVLTIEPLLNVLKLTLEWIRHGGE